MRLIAQALALSLVLAVLAIIGYALWSMGVIAFLVIYVVGVLWAFIHLSPENQT